MAEALDAHEHSLVAYILDIKYHCLMAWDDRRPPDKSVLLKIVFFFSPTKTYVRVPKTHVLIDR